MVLPRKALRGQGGPFMKGWQSQAHVKWEWKYHVVIVPKYRRKVPYGKIRRRVGEILRELCQQRGIELLEGKAMPDHVHLLLSVPPKYSIASHDRLFGGQERNPSPSECTEDKRDFVGRKLLVERVLCRHRGLGRERHSRVHQAPGETPKATGSIESGARLTAPFRGLPHTIGSAGGM